jgi:hypothetical protein
MECAATAQRVPHQVDAAIIHVEFLAHHLQDVHRIFLAEFGDLCRVCYGSSSDGRSPPPASAGRGCGGSPLRSGAASAEWHAKRAARAIAHRADQDKPAILRRIHGRGSHEGAVVTAKPVQCEDQRGRLVFGDLRGNEHGIGKVFAGLLEAVFA